MIGAAGIKGPGQASYYTSIAVAKGAEYYATSANLETEWMGTGAINFGLAGAVGQAELAELLMGRDPRTGQVLGRAFVEAGVGPGARGASSRGWDMTFSVPKEVSVLWAAAILEGRTDTAAQIQSAVSSAAREVVAEIEATYASTRVGPAGAQRFTEVAGVTAATFTQADSRNLDPQLHVHIVVSTKVLRPDGKWGTLHPTMLLKHRQALDQLGRAALGAELRDRLGIVVDFAARIEAVPPELCEALSTRRKEVVGRYSARAEEFKIEHGRAPTPLEAWRLRQLATTETRETKYHGHATTAVLDRSAEIFEALALEPGEVLASVPVREYCATRPDPAALGAEALEAVSARRSTWHRQDIAGAVAELVPDTWAARAPEVRSLVTEATEAAMARCVVLEAGTSRAYESAAKMGVRAPHSVICSTEALIGESAELAKWASRVGQGVPSAAAHDAAIDAGADALQAQAAGAVAGTAPVVLVVGPPGAGKTTIMSAAVAQLRAEGRPLVLAAESHQARQELEAAAGEAALTIAALRYQLREGLVELPKDSTIIIDEASMASTPDLVWLMHTATHFGARVALIGDPEQLGAVGRGGVFADFVAENAASVIELERLWRFSDPAEAQAALDLRAAKDGALEFYVDTGRLVPVESALAEAGAAAVAQCWEQATRIGAVGVFCDTNDQTIAANAAIQAKRIESGAVRPGPALASAMHDAVLHVGDLVALRGADEAGQVRTEAKKRIYNRDKGTVLDVSEDGLVVDFGTKGLAVLGPEVVAQRIELGYAATTHGSQGMTVGSVGVTGTGIYWRSQAGDAANLLVGVTRGRDANLIVGHAESLEDLAAELTGQMNRKRADVSPRAVMRETDAERQAEAERARVTRAPKVAETTTLGRLAQAWVERDSLSQLVSHSRSVSGDQGIRAEALGQELARRTEAAERADKTAAEARLGVESLGRSANPGAKAAAELETRRASATAAEARAARDRAQAASSHSATPGVGESWADAHQDILDRLEATRTLTNELAAARAAEALAGPPAHLVALLGTPKGPSDSRWRTAAVEIESYRARWGVTDAQVALDNPGKSKTKQRHLERVNERLDELGYVREGRSVGEDGRRIERSRQR